MATFSNALQSVRSMSFTILQLFNHETTAATSTAVSLGQYLSHNLPKSMY